MWWWGTVIRASSFKNLRIGIKLNISHNIFQQNFQPYLTTTKGERYTKSKQKLCLIRPTIIKSLANTRNLTPTREQCTGMQLHISYYSSLFKKVLVRRGVFRPFRVHSWNSLMIKFREKNVNILTFWNNIKIRQRNHPFGTCAKFSKKLFQKKFLACNDFDKQHLH